MNELYSPPNILVEQHEPSVDCFSQVNAVLGTGHGALESELVPNLLRL